MVPYHLITDHLTKVGLAYWFIDDGGMNGSHSYGIQIHTQSFTTTEVDNMCLDLNSKFPIDCWRGINKGKPIIIISSKSFSDFVNLAGPYIITSMKGKLSLR